MENPHEMGKNIIRLKYTYYRYFIEFLIESYGLEKLQAYIKSYLENPQNYAELFPEIYKKELNDVLNDFDVYMNP